MHLPPPARPLPVSRSIGVGLIGLSATGGWAGRAHVPALRALDGYELRALAASTQETAAAAARAHDVPLAFGTPGELVVCDEVDLVVVTVRVPKHAELVRAAIDAGKATYVTTLVDLFVGEGHMSSGWIHLRFQNDLLYVDHCLSDEDCENGVVTTYALRHGKVADVYTLHHKYKM